jgi:hypothetical protein
MKASPRTLRLLAAWLGVLALAVVAYVTAGAAQAIEPAEPGSADFVAFVIVIAGMALTTAGVGAFVLLRRPGNLIGTLLLVGAALLLGVFPAFAISVVRWSTAGPADPLGGLMRTWGSVMMIPAIFTAFTAVGIVFPDGRLPGPRWRVPMVVMIAAMVVGSALALVSPPNPDPASMAPANPLAVFGLPPEVGDLGAAISSIALLASFVVATLALATRFRRSHSVERAQVKWLLAALALNLVTFPLSWATDVGPAGLVEPAGLVDTLSVVAVGLVPAAIGIAVLRYRLFEIDRIVSRTVSYALVTALLAAVFVGTNLALQGLLSNVTGGSTLIVAASTLVVAALFRPVRIRIQAPIDRRFNRARSDAERVVAVFSGRTRDEVDLAQLHGSVVATATEAVRPTVVGLWLRGAG